MDYNYTTEENDVYDWSYGHLIEPPNHPPENDRSDIFIVLWSTWFNPEGTPNSVFQTAHTVSRPEFLASAAAAISGVFSTAPWPIPAGLIDQIASQIHSHLRLTAVIDLNIHVCGPLRRHPHGWASGLDRALRESMDQIRMSPASKEAIETLEEVEIFESSTETCSVCLEELISSSRNNRIVRMPCSHLYHKDCIVRWLETSNACPLCRYAYTS